MIFSATAIDMEVLLFVAILPSGSLGLTTIHCQGQRQECFNECSPTMRTKRHHQDNDLVDMTMEPQDLARYDGGTKGREEPDQFEISQSIWSIIT
jgi:hypothetical protein